MPPRPAKKSFKLPLSASSLEVADTGDVFTFSARYAIHRWKTAKTEVVTETTADAEAGTVGRLFGDRKLVSFSFNYTKQRDLGVIVERETGKLLHRLELKPSKGGRAIDGPREVAGSADGKYVALSFGHINSAVDGRGIDVFDALTGKHLQRITLPALCDGMIFSEDNETLLYFSDGKLHRHGVGEKTAKAVRCPVQSSASQPRVHRRDGHLFVQWGGFGHLYTSFVVDEAKAKVVLEVPEAEVSCFGPLPGTVVTSTGDEVQVLDLKGRKVGALTRDRKTRLEGAAPHPDGFFLGVTAGSSFLEVFDVKALAKKR